MATDIDGFLPDSSFMLDVPAQDWREAITLAGKGLTASGFTTEAYTGEMIAAVENLGPYMVIAPGLALAHSRPSAAVLNTGLSWVRLSTPVKFGNKANDPVSLVIGLAGKNEDEHIVVMSAIASALSDPVKTAQLKAAATPEDIRRILKA
ncbi:PTS system, ascorbate-specific IIA component [Bifidobacterium bohemicum]|uniref:Ascorbate-specific PTS system EIIA component n=1 Tax=Bifidobacterium bohemicum DSM 22767 TaxID=1437606 RepID=A0A086ZF27_9BIFI|nr:PTS sugar transporter subunit IIA [Bifidobacterium bohemicum]KFI45127.1 PTS system, ascorbate-specific IIA component [Bifidobacterium bohemicum DSM 22767]SCB90864.1 PTS system, ascorbate-specific IIA component [Bifidobacterium bohemicum]